MRLIDADRLSEAIYDNVPAPYEDASWAKENCLAEIEAAQTIDAVPVVRCRECKHHYWEQEPCHGKSVHYCNLPHMSGVEVFKEFFCYYGERKGGADNEP